MSKKRSGDVEILTEIYAAVASPMRLRILRELRDAGELNVGALVRKFRAWQPSVSHHLGLLRRRGLVTCRREGKTKLYRLNRAGFRLAASFLASLIGRSSR